MNYDWEHILLFMVMTDMVVDASGTTTDPQIGSEFSSFFCFFLRLVRDLKKQKREKMSHQISKWTKESGIHSYTNNMI